MENFTLPAVRRSANRGAALAIHGILGLINFLIEKETSRQFHGVNPYLLSRRGRGFHCSLDVLMLLAFVLAAVSDVSVCDVDSHYLLFRVFLT